MAAPTNLNKLQNFGVSKDGQAYADEVDLTDKKRIDAVTPALNRLEKVAVINEDIAIDEASAKEKITSQVPQKLKSISIVDSNEDPITESELEVEATLTVTIVIDPETLTSDLEVSTSDEEVVTIEAGENNEYTITAVAIGSASILAKSKSKPDVVNATLDITVVASEG